MLNVTQLPGTIPQLCLVLVILTLTVAYWWSRRKNLPPGPWGVAPYIGYVPNIAYAIYKGEEIHQHLVKLSNKFGKVFSFTIFGIPFVVLSDLKLIREAFQRVTLNDRGANKVQIRLFSRICKY